MGRGVEWWWGRGPVLVVSRFRTAQLPDLLRWEEQCSSGRREKSMERLREQFSPSHALEAAGNIDRAIDSTSSGQTVWAVCMGENPLSLNHERRRDLCILYADCCGAWVQESVGNALHDNTSEQIDACSSRFLRSGGVELVSDERCSSRMLRRVRHASRGATQSTLIVLMHVFCTTQRTAIKE